MKYTETGYRSKVIRNRLYMDHVSTIILSSHFSIASTRMDGRYSNAGWAAATAAPKWPWLLNSSPAKFPTLAQHGWGKRGVSRYKLPFEVVKSLGDDTNKYFIPNKVGNSNYYRNNTLESWAGWWYWCRPFTPTNKSQITCHLSPS